MSNGAVKRRWPPLHAEATGSFGFPAQAPAAEFTGEAQLHSLYLQGIEQFNRQGYFESHELWEALWKALASRPPTIVPSLLPKIELHPPPNGTSAMDENR